MAKKHIQTAYESIQEGRIVFMDTGVNARMATDICAQLLYLEKLDDKADIHLYINSPGGCVHSGLQIINTMEMIKPDVTTTVMGMAASMGFAIASAGAKGKRYALKHAQLMAHQVSAGTYGNVQDMIVSMEHTIALNKLLGKIIADNCGMDYDKYMLATARDLWMGAEEAVKFGVIDKVLTKKGK